MMVCASLLFCMTPKIGVYKKSGKELHLKILSFSTKFLVSFNAYLYIVQSPTNALFIKLGKV